MPQISLPAVQLALQQVSDVATGFNAALAIAAPAYGVTPFQINFSKTSPNFLIGRIDPKKLEASSSFTYPFMCLDTIRAEDQARTISAVFGGRITIVFDVWVSSVGEEFPVSIAPQSYAVEDAMFAVLNNIQNLGRYQAAGFTYDGKWMLDKSLIIPAGDNWLQRSTFSNAFGLITN